MDAKTILLLAPLVAFELAMRVAAIVSLARRKATRGPRVMWVLVTLLVNFGWAAYFLFGREEP